MRENQDDVCKNGLMKSDPSREVASEPALARRTVDDVDRALLRVLRDDARISVAELAKRANISRANAYARLDRLTTDRIIEGFETRVDPRAVGLDVTAMIFVTVDQSRWREIRDFLASVPEVEFVGLGAGDFDFVVLVRTSNADTLRDVVLERLHANPEVRDTRTVLLLDAFARAPMIP